MGNELEERTHRGLRITRREKGVYEVRSDSQVDVTYRVDLFSLAGSDGIPLGQCDCADFNFRLYPRWKSIQLSLPSLRCKHIITVRDHVMDQILLAQIYSEKQPKPNRT